MVPRKLYWLVLALGLGVQEERVVKEEKIMNESLRRCKQAIRAFLQTEVWSDEKLCALLAHADKKLVYYSCCCLIGTATADHALGSLDGKHPGFIAHYKEALCLPLAAYAEYAFVRLGWSDEERRRKVRPIILAELRRRERRKGEESVKREEREYAEESNSILETVTL